MMILYIFNEFMIWTVVQELDYKNKLLLNNLLVDPLCTL